MVDTPRAMDSLRRFDLHSNLNATVQRECRRLRSEWVIMATLQKQIKWEKTNSTTLIEMKMKMAKSERKEYVHLALNIVIYSLIRPLNLKFCANSARNSFFFFLWWEHENIGFFSVKQANSNGTTALSLLSFSSVHFNRNSICTLLQCMEANRKVNLRLRKLLSDKNNCETWEMRARTTVNISISMPGY